MSNLKSINNLKLLFTNYLPHPHITSTSVVLTYIFYLIIKWAEWVILDMYELIACICKNSWQHIWFFLSNIYIYIYMLIPCGNWPPYTVTLCALYPWRGRLALDSSVVINTTFCTPYDSGPCSRSMVKF